MRLVDAGAKCVLEGEHQGRDEWQAIEGLPPGADCPPLIR